jgi:hypothetical protein
MAVECMHDVVCLECDEDFDVDCGGDDIVECPNCRVKYKFNLDEMYSEYDYWWIVELEKISEKSC